MAEDVLLEAPTSSPANDFVAQMPVNDVVPLVTQPAADTVNGLDCLRPQVEPSTSPESLFP
jgi:hypothetical protein